MSESNYVPVSERQSGDFGSSLLETGMGAGGVSNSSSPFPMSSNFTPNQRSQYSGAGGGGGSKFELPDWALDIVQKPVTKLVVGGIVVVSLIAIIVSAAGGSGGDAGYAPGGGNRYGGMNCEGKPDQLYGSTVYERNGHYYQAIGGTYAKITWHDAVRDASHRCHNGATGYLVTIQDKAENDFVLNLVKGTHTYGQGQGGDGETWIGAVDMKTEGTFEWFTGNKHTDGEVFWKGGDPNNGGKAVSGTFNYFENSANGFGTTAHEPNSNGDEDCVIMRGGHTQGATSGTQGSWTDVACYQRFPFFVVEFDK
jgi:hypothetical protein